MEFVIAVDAGEFSGGHVGFAHFQLKAVPFEFQPAELMPLLQQAEGFTDHLAGVVVEPRFHPIPDQPFQFGVSETCMPFSFRDYRKEDT